MYAGVHYPIDGIAGRVLGHTLAEFVLARSGGGTLQARRFALGDQLADADLNARDDLDAGPDRATVQFDGVAKSLPVDKLLKALLDAARTELQGLGYPNPAA